MSDTPMYTDIWAGEEFSKMHGDLFRYLVDRKVWLTWDGQRWRDADDGDLVRAAKDTAKEIFQLALDEDEDGLRKRALTFANHATGRAGISAMIYFASASPIFAMRRAQFDTHPHFLNVANGTLDLRDGTLRPQTREDYLTTLTPIVYTPDASCPRWNRFLREIFVKKDENDRNVVDEDLIKFVHRAVGYSLTGYTREHAFFILHGVGRNGKGRFIRMLSRLLGDAARTTHFKTFLTLSSSSINSPAVASLAGARLVTAGEPDEGAELSESLIKSLTGEDEIEAMAKYEAPFRYTPAYKLFFHCNHKPAIRGTDEGIWSRPRMIPFNVRFDNVDGKDMRDLKLDEKLDAEIAGILVWAVRGAMLWFAEGLGRAESVSTATEDYRREQDVIGAFLDECMMLDLNASTPASRVHDIYTSWCLRNGTRYPLSPEKLRTRLDGRDGIKWRRTKSARLFDGIRERTSADADDAKSTNGSNGTKDAPPSPSPSPAMSLDEINAYIASAKNS